MTQELEPRECRYLEAYLELETQSSVAPQDGARERVIATAFAEAGPVLIDGPSRRAPSRGVLLAVGLGLCAAMLLGWWSGSVSMVEVSTAPEQAPLSRVMGPVYEATQPTPAPDATARPQQIEPAMVVSEPEFAEQLPTVEPERDPAPARRGSARTRTSPRPAPVAPAEVDVPAEVAGPTLDPAEVAQLDRARRLARRGEHEAALAKLREHAKTYPASLLATERVAEEVAVLCRMGSESAEAARSEFLAGDPPQYLRGRVARACAQ